MELFPVLKISSILDIFGFAGIYENFKTLHD
jgi:hypothetical protein